ncbi:hypothetical protein RF11_03894 [Thelohanellus kitauei]|uniref:Tc1-like transposase DDE domain-containing protein n=1 Tax=Thelohanellus kitauei TaxID=669202 RepID=A0A0C2MBU9_THEKT|nr:hypothetical protein RF11_03894 [Thelohanellus kitauei]
MNGDEICIFLPYSPFRNPIEEVFSKWKGYFKRKKPRNEDQPSSNTEEGLATIARLDCDGYYRQMKTYVRQFINNKQETVIISFFIFRKFFILNLSHTRLKWKNLFE